MSDPLLSEVERLVALMPPAVVVSVSEMPVIYERVRRGLEAMLVPAPSLTPVGADSAESVRAALAALKPRVEAAIERERNTPRCPTCGSDGEPFESYKGLCTNPFHSPATRGEKQ